MRTPPDRARFRANRMPIAHRAPVAAAALCSWACLSAAASFGQAAGNGAATGAGASAAFDGQYIGGTALTHAGAICDPVGVGAEMTIAEGQATIRTIQSNSQPGVAFSGAVDPSGKMRAAARRLIVGVGGGDHELRLTAVIDGRGQVTGDIRGSACHWDLNMIKK
jgi:hypothetical protein